MADRPLQCVRTAPTPEAYLDAVAAMARTRAFPVLGCHQGPIKRMTAAYGLDDLVVAPWANGRGNHGAAATGQHVLAAYQTCIEDEAVEPDPGLVVGIGAAAPAAACHAAARGSRLALVDDPASLEQALGAAAPPQSLTVVGLGDCFGPATVRYLDGFCGTGVPWGILTGRTLPDVSWVVLKQRLARGRAFGRQVLLHAAEEAPAGGRAVGPVAGVYREEITTELLSRLTTVPHDLVTFTGHGDQADVDAYAGRICSRTHPRYGELAEATGGAGLMRCFAEAGCYRNEISAAATGRAAGDLVLLPGDELLATTVLLNSCGSMLMAPGYRYDPESSLLRACLEGTAASVVVAQTPRRSDPAEAILFSALLWTGRSIGEATLLLNAIQDRRFTGSPVFCVFGDPDLAPGPAAGSAPVVRHDGDLVAVAASAQPAVRIRLPEPLGSAWSQAGGRARIELAGAAPGIHAFVVPAVAGPELVIASDRGPLGDTRVLLRAAATPLLPGPARHLQRRLGALDGISCPVDAGDRGPLAEALAGLLRAAQLAAEATTKAGEERQAAARVNRELLMLEQRAVRGWVDSWNAALGGEMLSLREERALYGKYRASDERCPNCRAPLYLVLVSDAYLPDTVRELRLCPSCTVVADVPQGRAPLRVSAPGRVTRGHPYHLTVELPGAAGRPGAAVLGAALLGARGQCRPAIVPVPFRDAGSDVRLTVWVGSAMVPGSYSLRVVVMDDLECSFHLQPVSVTVRLLSAGTAFPPGAPRARSTRSAPRT
jgi:hypothetical protein